MFDINKNFAYLSISLMAVFSGCQTNKVETTINIPPGSSATGNITINISGSCAKPIDVSTLNPNGNNLAYGGTATQTIPAMVGAGVGGALGGPAGAAIGAGMGPAVVRGAQEVYNQESDLVK